MRWRSARVSKSGVDRGCWHSLQESAKPRPMRPERRVALYSRSREPPPARGLRRASRLPNRASECDLQPVTIAAASEMADNEFELVVVRADASAKADSEAPRRAADPRARSFFVHTALTRNNIGTGSAQHRGASNMGEPVAEILRPPSFQSGASLISLMSFDVARCR